MSVKTFLPYLIAVGALVSTGAGAVACSSSSGGSTPEGDAGLTEAGGDGGGGGGIKGDKEISVTVVQYGSAGNTPLPDAWVRIEKGGGTKDSKVAFLEKKTDAS